ncbi:GNAT family N-acetyltransferase [Lichenifustis flavocetrariae]|uniref:GNAT family N-acetyltransferase n=1 Tax=Lichenifustis flavocetrariae TaxID=2949735 RepID=A0AA41YVV0_9HYPH|nr:GNAT family N-acetyltransferase [Lichenifustis flavocetrariae]MCW6509554.1 GNAT family N-acetyltransferase [Lichenifustis flavocetrariae]
MNHPARVASLSDAPALLDLVREHAAFERGMASLSLSDLGTILSAASPPTRLLVAESDGTLIGYAAVTFDFSLWRASRYGHLDCLFVASSARGRGAGRKLFEAAAGFARAEGADWLEWQTPAWNSEAISFYQRAGALQATKERFAMPFPVLFTG